MISGIKDFKNVFFIGVAGVGMSAIAQYLAGIDKKVSGSDRYFKEGELNENSVAEDFSVTASDGKNYKTKQRVPISFNYKGYTVVTMPPPSSGGIIIQQMLEFYICLCT